MSGDLELRYKETLLIEAERRCGVKKGNIPWNKGLKGVQAGWNKGKPRSEETKKKIRETRIRKGIPTWNKGIPRSEETKRKIRETRIRKGIPTWNKGIPHSEETKRKISEANKGCKGYFKGKAHTKETRKKLSEARRGRHKGDQNPNWKGGISFQLYPEEFNNKLKRKIMERDDFKCQLCGLNRRLTVHHIDYDKRNNSEDNLITLCNRHNVTANFSRDKWEFLYAVFSHQAIRKQRKY